MGHVRIGRLPKRFGWQHVVAALYRSTSTDSEVVNATALAARSAIIASKQLDSVAYCYWLFVTLADASRRREFQNRLSEIGIPEIAAQQSGVGLIAAISNVAHNYVRTSRGSNALDEIALQAFETVVTASIVEQSNTLFGQSAGDIEAAFRQLSTKTNVGDLGRRYFSEYTFRSLRYALERELASSLGTDGPFRTSQDLSDFHLRLRAYCWDVSEIVHDFAGGWFSKAAWQRHLGLEDARRFTAYSLEKILSELATEAE